MPGDNIEVDPNTVIEKLGSQIGKLTTELAYRDAALVELQRTIQNQAIELLEFKNKEITNAD